MAADRHTDYYRQPSRPTRREHYPSGMHGEIYETPGYSVSLRQALARSDCFAIITEVPRSEFSEDTSRIYLLNDGVIIDVSETLADKQGTVRYASSVSVKDTEVVIDEGGPFSPGARLLQRVIVVSNDPHDHLPAIGEPADNPLAELGSKLIEVLEASDKSIDEDIRPYSSSLAGVYARLQYIVNLGAKQGESPAP